MNASVMKDALKSLDSRLKVPVNLLIGGGAAMLLAHGFPLSTMDIDGIVFKSGMTQEELDPHVKAVAKEVGIPPDWLNGHFNTFLYTLPPDYDKRLKLIHDGKNLKVYALSAEDLLILKCFAGRPKDAPHARSLFRKITDRALVENHLERLLEKNIPGARKALDFFDELQGELDA